MTIHSAAWNALAAARHQMEQVASRVSRADPSGALISDSVDISEEMVRLLAARRAFQTAARLARAADELDQHTLEILA